MKALIHLSKKVIEHWDEDHDVKTMWAIEDLRGYLNSKQHKQELELFNREVKV